MPTVDNEIITRLIGRFYEAALDEKLWPVVIVEFLRAVNFDNALFLVFDEKKRIPLIGQSIHCAPNVLPEFLEHYFHLDTKVEYLIKHPGVRTLYDYQACTGEEMDRLEYFDWLKLSCGSRYHLAGIFRPLPNLVITVGMARTAHKGHVDKKEIEFFNFLYQHFERALQVSFRLGQSAAMANTSLQALDTHPLALVLLDRRGQVQYTNAAAVALTQDPNGIRMSTHEITLPRHTDQQRLQELITCAIATSLGAGLSSGGMMSVSRGAGRRPLCITVAPLSKTGGTRMFEFGKPCAMVLIADPEKQRLVPEEHLRTLYDLSKAEAKLAVLLATGMNLEQAAEHLSISLNTVRTQLAHIFDKTGTSRQVELVSLFLNSAPAIAVGKYS